MMLSWSALKEVSFNARIASEISVSERCFSLRSIIAMLRARCISSKVTVLGEVTGVGADGRESALDEAR